MQEGPKTGRVTICIEEVAFHNMFLVEALFELLAEKGILKPFSRRVVGALIAT